MKKYSNEIKMVLFIIIAALLMWTFNSCTYYICDCKKEPVEDKLTFDKRIIYSEYSTLELRCDSLTQPSFMPGIIGVFHPDSGRVVRIRIGNAERRVNYLNPKYGPNIRGFKNFKGTNENN